MTIALYNKAFNDDELSEKLEELDKEIDGAITTESQLKLQIKALDASGKMKRRELRKQTKLRRALQKERVNFPKRYKNQRKARIAELMLTPEKR